MYAESPPSVKKYSTQLKKNYAEIQEAKSQIVLRLKNVIKKV